MESQVVAGRPKVTRFFETRTGCLSPGLSPGRMEAERREKTGSRAGTQNAVCFPEHGFCACPFTCFLLFNSDASQVGHSCTVLTPLFLHKAT